MNPQKFATLLALVFPASALASITGSSGAVFLPSAAPPAFVQGLPVPGAPPLLATAWDELQGVSVALLPADMVNNPGSIAAPTAGTVSGLVDSHYLFFRHGTTTVSGTLTFSGNIIGLMFTSSTLFGSDPALMPTTTTYTPTASLRGLSPFVDAASISANTMSFTLFGDLAYGDTAEVRIITEHVPAPGSAALLAAAGFAAARRRRPGGTIAA